MSTPFRRRSALAMHDLHFGPNMTPMVDVVMVILIFFMASATFAGAEWFVKAGIPREGASTGNQGQGVDPLKLPPARFEVMLSLSSGRTVARGPGIGEAELSELPARLTALAAGLSADDLVLIIRPEPDVPYPDVIRAHDAAAQAGIKKVGMMDVASSAAGSP